LKQLRAEGQVPTFVGVLTKLFPKLEDSLLDAATNGSGLLGVFQAMTPVLIPLAAALAAVAVGFAAFKYFDYKNSGWTRAQEAASKAVDEYKSAQSKLESLEKSRDSNVEAVRNIATKYNVDTTGLDTADEIIERIRAAEASGDIHLSLVDEAELSKLQRANTDVQTQIKLQEQLAKAKKESMVEATEKATQTEKSYWEVVKERHGSGFFGKIAAGFDYLFSNRGRTYTDELGNEYTYKTEGDLFRETESGKTTTLDLAKKSFEEYKKQKTDLEALDKEILEQQGDATQQQIEQREKLRDGLIESTQNLTGYLDTLHEQADILAESSTPTAKAFVQDAKKLFLEFENFGLSDTEKALNNLNHFFTDNAGGSTIKEALREAADQGLNLIDVLGEMGLTLGDLGLSNSDVGLEYLNDYFTKISKQAEDASKAVDDFRVSVDDVEAATKSTNKDADWKTIQGAYKSAKELLNEGQIGTDDFQTVAQFMSPKNIAKLAQQAKDSGEYAAYEYQKAFEDAKEKADRWFGEDETASMENFANDMQKAGLVDIDKNYQGRGLWDIQSKFQNTAEAANALGTSVEVVETMLSGLESYGYDFSNIKKSGEMFREYTDTLDALRQVYNQMDEGSTKDKLGKLIEGFDQEYQTFNDDLSNLTEEQVVHIKFEYDMAQLQMDIDNLKAQIEATGGGGTVADNAALIVKQDKYISQGKSGTGLDKEGVTLPVEFVAAANTEQKLKEELKNTSDESRKVELQAEIENQQDIQKEVLDSFANEHPEITPEADVSQINNALQSQFDTVVVDAEVNTDNINQYLSSEKGSTITFTANIDGVESQIEAVRNEDGTITYTTEINGETVSEDDLNKFGTITYDVQTEGKEQVAEDQEATVTFSKNSTEPDNYKAEEKPGLVVFKKDSSEPDNYQPSDKGATVRYSADTSRLPSSFSTITRYVNYVKTGAVGVDGTAHAQGTAFANGNISGNWGTKHGGVALGGEVGEELIVRDGRFFTIGANGAEMFSYRPKDIIFNAEQTKQILEKGAITHGVRRGRALAEGTAFLLGKDTSSSSSSSGSSKHKSKKKSSGSSSKKKSSDKDDNKEETRVDWIDVNIDRIEREIKHLKTLADSTYNTFSGRNKNLQKEINSITSEITLQKKAWDRYNQEFYKAAAEGKLSSDIIEKIKNGTIDITKYDSDTQKAITEAKKWRDKALDAKDAIDKLKESVSALTKQKFDNAVKEWSNSLLTLQRNSERLESTINNRTEKASDYLTSGNKTSASNSNISDYRKLIKNAQQQRSIRQKEVNDLTKKLNDAVNSGAIKKYSEAYYSMLSQIQSVSKEIESIDSNIIEYTNNIAKEYRNIFDQVAQNSENVLSITNHFSEMYSKQLEIAQAKGYVTSTKYYSKMKKIEEGNLKESQTLAKDLQTQLNKALKSGAIKRGSQEWYDMTQRINEAKEATLDAAVAMAEYDSKIQEVEWERFDYLIERIGELTKESDFLIDLMSDSNLFDEKGNVTSEGRATFGLHAMNYDTYKNEAQRYANELKKINAQLAKDPNNTKLLEHKKDLLAATRETILAEQKELQSIKSLVEDGIKKEISYLDDLISKYNDALDSQKTLYDYQRKVDSQTKEISSLQKQLSAYSGDKSEETMARVQKIAQSLKEAQDNLKDTEYDKYITDSKKMLDDLKSDYEETLNKRLDDVDQLIKDVISQVDSDSSEIMSTLSSEAEKVGYSLSDDIKSVWNDSSNLLRSTNSTLNNIYTAVQAIWDYAGQMAQKDIESVSNDNKKKNEQEKKAATPSTPSTNKSTASESSTKSKKSDTVSATYTGLFKDSKGVTYYYVKGKKQTGWKNMNAGRRYFSVKDGHMLVGQQWIGGSTYYFDTSTGVLKTGTFKIGDTTYQTDANGKVQFKAGYKNITSNNITSNTTGVKVGTLTSKFASGSKNISHDQLAWTSDEGQELLYKSGSGAILTPLRKGDKVFTSAMSDKLWNISKPNGLESMIGSIVPSYIKSEMTDALCTLRNSLSSGYGNITQNFDNITFSLPNVKDYNSLVKQMQVDKKFESLIQSMTIGRVNGKPSSMKRHIKF